MRRVLPSRPGSPHPGQSSAPRGPRRRAWPALGTLAAVLFPLSVLAQPALQNAVVTDRAVALREEERATSVEEVEGPQAGPVRFSLSASYSLEFNDNVNTSENDPTGDFIQVPSVSLGIAAPISQRSDLSFQVGVGYQFYWHNESLSRVTINPGSELAYDLQIKDVFITLFDRFSYTEDVTTAPDIANQTQFPRMENTIGTQVTWVPDRFLVAAGYSYQITLSTDQSFDYLNRGSHLPFLRAGYLFAEGAANSGVEFSATFTDYESNINSDSTIVSFGPYLDWQLNESLEAALRGGFLYVVNSLTLLPEESFNADNYYVGLNVSQDLTTYISQELAVDHGIRPSFQRGIAFTEETSVNYRVSWAFIDPAVLRVNLGYVHGQQTVAAGVAPVETYDQWRAEVGVSYALTTRLSSTLAYDYIQRDSNQNGRSYTQNQITLGLSYRFE